MTDIDTDNMSPEEIIGVALELEKSAHELRCEVCDVPCEPPFLFCPPHGEEVLN